MDEPAAHAPGAMPMLDAVELQDQLLCAATELDRLQRLLADAAGVLMDSFARAHAALHAQLDPGDRSSDERAAQSRQAIESLGAAAKALQFQDMASQLIAFTQRRLSHCADRLASAALADDEAVGAVIEAAPDRPNPVVQGEMNTGFVELF